MACRPLAMIFMSLDDYDNSPFLRKDKDGNLKSQTIGEYFEQETYVLEKKVLD